MSKEVHIDFNLDVNEKNINNLRLCIYNQLIEATKVGTTVDHIVVYLNTFGGNPHHAIDLYNVLKSLPMETTAYNMGAIASAGSIMFLGFKNRFACPEALYNIHNTTNTNGASLNQHSLREAVRLVRTTDIRTAKIIATETSLTIPRILRDMKANKYFTDVEAKAVGIVHDIKRPIIPHGTFIVTG